MLLYSIKGPVSVFERAAERWKEKFAATPPSRGTCKWDKLQYSQWVEKVKEKFKVGDRVTFASCPPIASCLPYHMEITYINELHHYIEYDSDIQEPKAIVCRNMRGTFENKCPATLRPLTYEELCLVNLSNQKSQGTA